MLLFLHILIVSALSLLLLNAIISCLLFPVVQPGGETAPLGKPWPKLSILVPARNEEDNIGACASSLQAQDYPDYEVIVLDDRSEDDTEGILLALGFQDKSSAKHRLIRGTPLPADWGGKPWACHQLSQAAKGDYLLFTDADTIHAPDCARAAVALAMRENISLLSFWPRQITGTFAEKLIIPLLYVLSIGFLPHWFFELLHRKPERFRHIPGKRLEPLGGANGQFLLFSRDAYEKIGGHECVKNHLVEDVALGRTVLSRQGEGLRLRNADARHFLACRMYRNLDDVWRGFSKNIRPVFERGGDWLFFGFGLATFTLLVWPYLSLFSAWPEIRRLAMVEVGLILAFRFLLVMRFGTSWLGALFHPVAMLLAYAIGFNSWRWSKSGKVQWKGRIYDPKI